MKTKDITLKNGETITAYQVDNDVNGNPRYVVHFLDFGIDLGEYDSIHTKKLLRKAGGKIYRAKWFGGGYLFSSYNIKATIQRAHDILNGVKQ